MRKINHSKYKNTLFLFEILTRQVTLDTLSQSDDSKALRIIKKHFQKGTELYKEYHLYDALIKSKFQNENRAQSFIDRVVKLRSNLNLEKLNSEKYNLIKSIKESYDLKQMFSTQLNDYKVYGSIYILFESNLINESYNITQHQHCNDVILDYMLTIASTTQPSISILERYNQQDKEIRLLAYKMLIERFNKKYHSLNEKQKKLLKEYINNVSNTNSLRQYMNSEVESIKENLNFHLKKVNSKVSKIKLEESIKLLDTIKKGNIVKNNQLKSMLYYYELIDNLNQIHNIQ